MSNKRLIKLLNDRGGNYRTKTCWTVIIRLTRGILPAPLQQE